MIELILVMLLALVLGYHAWYVRETNSQLREYMKGFMARDLQDFVVAKKIEQEGKKEEKEEDLVLENEAEEHLFDRIIKTQTALGEEQNG